jgi:hypothetical protein
MSVQFATSPSLLTLLGITMFVLAVRQNSVMTMPNSVTLNYARCGLPGVLAGFLGIRLDAGILGCS